MYDYTLNRNQLLKKMITLISSGWDLLPEDRAIVVSFLNELQTKQTNDDRVQKADEIMKAMRMIIQDVAESGK